MINRIVIVGRLTRDIELRYTQDKIAVISFTIAIDRPQIGKSDRKVTDFINCTAWRNTAEFAAKYAVKGALVGVDGRLQVRTYENKEGKKVSTSEVLCESFQLYEWKKDNNAAPSERSYQNIPSNTSNSNSSYEEESIEIEEESNSEKFDLSDDDLPF